MQGSENKGKHAGKHAAPIPEESIREKVQPDPQEDLLFEDYDDLLPDESEIPVRLKKKPSSAKKKKKSSKKKSGGKHGKSQKLFSEKKFRQKKSLFDVFGNSGDDGVIKPLTLFGYKIRFWPIILIALIVLFIGFVVIKNGDIKALNETITVVGLPEDLENYNILLLSDLNGKRFGDKQSALIRDVEAQDYDIILCLGDMVGKNGDPEPFYEFLDGLKRPQRVYFICGDSDPGPYVETAREIEGTLQQIVLEDWILGAIERGANYVDAPLRLEVGEAYLWLTPSGFMNTEAVSYRDDWEKQTEQEEDGVITGLGADYDTLPFTAYRSNIAQRFYTAAGEAKSTDFVIALSHQIPNDVFIESASTHDPEDGKYLTAPELIVAGHNCGGVWKMPIMGAFYVPNDMLPRYGWFPAKEDVSGLSQIGESQVYITGGLSTTASVPVLTFRFLNDPEMTLLTFTAKLSDSILDQVR